MRRTLPIAAAVLAALAVTQPLASQAAGAEAGPPRPELPSGADPNDWQAYFDHGARILKVHPATAGAAFYWASRLDPSRAEPLFARYVAFHAADMPRYEEYLRGSERVREQPAVQRNHQLWWRAMLLNPFVHRGLEVAVMDQAWDYWGNNLATQGWLQYAEGRMDVAARTFRRLVESGGDNYRYRYERALALVGMNDYDGARAELEALVAELHRRDASTVGNSYRSKEFYEYAIGLLHLAQGNHAGARAAFERSLVEHAGFYPSRAGLGQVSLAEGNAAAAVEEYEQAVRVKDDDPVLRYEHGRALLAAGRAPQAAAELARAVELEPHWAEPYLFLGAAHEADARFREALAAYDAFLQRAPRRMDAAAERARQRAARLREALAQSAP